VGYTGEAIKGVSWMGALRVFVRGLGFIRIAILARLLTPFQFGVYGIAALVLAFLEIATETGINIFLIQLKDEIDKYVSTAWLISIARGFLISVMILVSAPYIARYFGFSESYPLFLIVSMVPLIRGFINPSIVKYQKDLLFNKEFLLRTSLYATDAIVVIVIALMTRSAASLVCGLVISSLLEVILSFRLIKPRPRFIFDATLAKQVLSRGKWVTGFGLFGYLYQNVDDAVVGKIMGASPLGIYQVAYKISSLPVSEIADVFAKVTLPVYLKFANDTVRLKRAFLKTSSITSILMIFFGVFIFLFPKQIVLILLGSNWLSAVEVLKILVLFGVLKGITGMAESLFLAVQKQEYVTLVTFITLSGLATTIIPFVKSFGIIGAGISAVFGSILGLLVSFYFTIKILRKD